MSIEEDTEDLDDESMIDEATVLQHCSSLIRKRTTFDDSVGFAHFSVLEFLQGPSLLKSNLDRFHISKRSASKSFAISSLRLLCLDEISHTPAATADEVKYISTRNQQHPFYSYASLLWPVYANTHWEDDTVSYLVGRLFGPEKSDIFLCWAVELCRQFLESSHLQVRGLINAPPEVLPVEPFVNMVSALLWKGFTPLHLAAAIGLDRVCKMFLEGNADVNSRCPFGTPLYCASSSTSVFCNRAVPWDDRSLSSISNFSDADEASDVDCPAKLQRYELHHSLDDSLRIFDHARPRIVDLFLENGAVLRDASGTNRHVVPLFQRALNTCFRMKNFDIVASLIKAGIELRKSDLDHFATRSTYSWRASNREEATKIANHLNSFLAFLKDASSTSKAAAELYPLAFEFTISLGKNDRARPVGVSLSTLRNSLNNTLEVALMAIHYDNDVELASILEKEEIDLSQSVNSNGQTLLHIAVQRCSVESVRLLLQRGCSQLIPDFEGMLPIWLCSQDKHNVILRLLLSDNGSQGTAKNAEGNTIWHVAASSGSCLVLQALIEMSTDVQGDLNVKNRKGRTPLSEALHREQIDATLMLLDHCQDQVLSWTDDVPLFQLAAQLGSSDVVQKLLDSGVETKYESPDSSTPLHHLGPKATVACVKLLKSIYPDLQMRNRDGRRALEIFAVRTETLSPKNLQIFDELIPYDMLISREDGLTFWEQFCSGIQFDDSLRMRSRDWIEAIVSRLINLGVISTYEKTTKDSAITILVSKLLEFTSHKWVVPEILEKALEKLFEVTQYADEARNSDVLVALLNLGVQYCEKRTTVLLLEKGVNAHQKYNRHSALELACSSRTYTELEIFRPLLQAIDKTRLNDLDTEGLGLLHLMGEKNRYYREGGLPMTRRLELVVGMGADPNLCTKSGVPALIFHIKKRKFETATRLVDLGADPIVVDARGLDAIMHATLRGSVDFLARLWTLEQLKGLPNPIDWSRKVNLTWKRKMRRRSRRESKKGPLRLLSSVGHGPLRFENCNALHLAALQGHTAVLEFFLKKGLIPDVEEMAGGGLTPMHFAAYCGSAPAIRLLHSWGGDLDAVAETRGTTNNGQTPIQIAIERKHAAAVRTLLDLGSKKPIVDSGKNVDDIDLQQWESDGSDLSRLDTDTTDTFSTTNYSVGSSARPWDGLNEFDDPVVSLKDLEFAIETGDMASCKGLAERGCQLNGEVPSCGGCSPLLVAIRRKRIKIIEWLLENGASTDVVVCSLHNNFMETAPCFAARKAKLNPILPTILSHYHAQGGNLLSDLPVGPLYTALRVHNFDALETILDQIKQEEGRYKYASYIPFATCLTKANRALIDSSTANAPRNNSNVISMLLNQTDDKGRAPLHYAAAGASLHAAKLLIKEGAQVDIRSTEPMGGTPLHFAAATNAAQVIDYLLQQGASSELRDRYEDTPMMVAAKFHCLDALKIFFKWNVDSAAKDSDGAGVLSRCVAQLAKKPVLYDAQVVLYLVQVGLDPNQADKLGIAPIHHIFPSERLRGFFINGALSIENTPPYPWKELWVAKGHWIKGEEDKTFYLLVRALGVEALQRILNLHPAEGISPLCLAAWMGDVNRMQDFISIGADVEFENSEKGTALMAACSYGQLEAVKFLVRGGARISYWSKGHQHSALRAANRHPIIVNWLLVERFRDQPRIVEICDLTTPQSLEKLCFWSGPHQAELPLKGRRKRRNDESGISWLARLTQMRRDLYGKVAFGIEVSGTTGEV